MTCELSSPGWLARHPWVGLMLIVVGSLVFGVLAFELRSNGSMVQWDTQWAATFHGWAQKIPGPLLELMTYGFFLGKEDLQLLGAILVIYFLHKRFWAELGMVLIGWSGGSLVWNALVYTFNRPRPQQQFGMPVHSIPSFPSGHSMFVLLAFGLLAYLLVPKMPSRFWKWVIALAALLLVLFVGFSRAFEGGHYISDVLAGYAVALAWGGLVYTLLDGLVARRQTARQHPARLAVED
jgi:membrane-associated phospholipid phosphatase